MAEDFLKKKPIVVLPYVISLLINIRLNLFHNEWSNGRDWFKETGYMASSFVMRRVTDEVLDVLEFTFWL